MAKNLSKLILPYNFKGFTLGILNPNYLRVLNPAEAERTFGGQIYPTFSSIFTSVLTAMCEGDFEYLEGVMERRLFETTKRDIEKLKSNKMQLNYLEAGGKEESENNEEANDLKAKITIRRNVSWVRATGKEKAKILFNIEYDYKESDMQMFLEPYGVLGADICRDKNTSDVAIFPGLTRRFYVKKPYTLKSFTDLYHKQILVLNVYYFTKRKLFVSDEENFVVHGSENTDQWLPHKWRFESFVEKLDWVLTDMDDYLIGNPYFSRKIELDPKV